MIDAPARKIHLLDPSPILLSALRHGQLVIVLVLFSLVASNGASAQETGNVCVQDTRPSATCGTDDVRLEVVFPQIINENCEENVAGEAEVLFEILISADTTPDRYDIGVFIALDGGDAKSGGSCFHDYLAPPLTPAPSYADSNANGVPDITNGGWWDGGPDADQCGDAQGGTELIKTLVPIRFECVDTNGDGSADLGVCTSWANNASPSCGAVGDARPETDTSCGCRRVETGVAMPTPPVPIFDARHRVVLVGVLALSALGIAARSRLRA